MNYEFLFVWLGLMLLFQPTDRSQTVTRGQPRRVPWAFAVTVFLPVFGLAVFGPARSDVWAYLSIYRILPHSLDDILHYLTALSDSQLFWSGALLIRNLTNANETAFRFAIALIQSIGIIYLFRQYSDDYLLSIYLVVASGVPLAWMMNGIRQFTAVAIILLATPWMLEKKYGKVCLVILIAALVHRSAILMLPVVFAAQGKAWNKRTMLTILGAIVATFVFSRVRGVYESMMDMAGYDMANYAADDGTNPLRVLVNAVPVLLAYLAKDETEMLDDPIINLSINMSLISLGVYLVSMVTSGILVGRIPIYMSLYSFILLPALVKRIYNEGIWKMLPYAIVGFYGLYYILLY